MYQKEVSGPVTDFGIGFGRSQLPSFALQIICSRDLVVGAYGVYTMGKQSVNKASCQFGRTPLKY